MIAHFACLFLITLVCLQAGADESKAPEDAGAVKAIKSASAILLKSEDSRRRKASSRAEDAELRAKAEEAIIVELATVEAFLNGLTRGESEKEIRRDLAAINKAAYMREIAADPSASLTSHLVSLSNGIDHLRDRIAVLAYELHMKSEQFDYNEWREGWRRGLGRIERSRKPTR